MMLNKYLVLSASEFNRSFFLSEQDLDPTYEEAYQAAKDVITSSIKDEDPLDYCCIFELKKILYPKNKVKSKVSIEYV